MPPGNERKTLLLGALRWIAAAGIATLVTGSLFVSMAGLIDGAWILDQLIRVFPLQQTELDPEERCGLGPPRRDDAVIAEGTVGTSRDGAFVPLGDARVRAENGAASRPVEVEPDGRFRAVVSLPGPPRPGCEADDAPLPTPQLVVGAPGCLERSVPVTRAWIPRRILLTCAPRS